MCNAFNHSYSCTCGWGGDGHTGKRIGNYANNSKLPQFKVYSQILRSCTVPNARCPVCGIKVFFYSSPNGGRVFFDELGPPWPKHGCTDNGRHVVVRNISDSDDLPIKTFSGIKGEWQPFLCLSVSKVGPKKDICEISGDLNGITKNFYTRVGDLTDKYPYFIKESDDEVRMSTFIEYGGKLEVFEFLVKIYLSEIQNITPTNTGIPVKVIKAKSNQVSQEKIKKITKLLAKKNNSHKEIARNKVINGKLQDQLSNLKELIFKLKK
jgi:hypothetical protein